MYAMSLRERDAMCVCVWACVSRVQQSDCVSMCGERTLLVGAGVSEVVCVCVFVCVCVCFCICMTYALHFCMHVARKVCTVLLSVFVVVLLNFVVSEHCLCKIYVGFA